MIHTPGPWELDYNVPGYPNVWGADRTHVCQTMEANARLIAAAPDLLKALELIASARERGFDIYYAEECARAAIMKARGKA